jgi:acyl transferase domain-containing protein
MTHRPLVGRTHREPIAIVGIGCRFPGAADSLAFDELLLNGVNAIGEIPRDRFDLDSL